MSRDKALLSHIWNYAWDMGYTALANPCSGITGNTEKGRDAYLGDSLYKSVYGVAEIGQCDAVGLACLAGQCVTDTRLMDERGVCDGYIWVEQAKTKAKRRIEVVGELALLLLDRIRAQKAGRKVRSTRLIVAKDGSPMSAAMLRGVSTLPGRWLASRNQPSSFVTFGRRPVPTRQNRVAIFSRPGINSAIPRWS